MTVKDKVGRNRYIGFIVESADRIRREDLLCAINEASRLAGLGTLQLTVYYGGRGILKVPHRLKEKSIGLLCGLRTAGRAPLTISTVVTSGTICSVKYALKIPKQKPGERRGRPQAAIRPPAQPDHRQGR